MAEKKHMPAFTPELLVEHNRLFNIPIYQRLFVWGEEQINLLLNDLFEAMTSNEPYFVGIVTVARNGEIWDIVDGQQRLTFLSLLAAYFNNLSGKSPWHKFLFTPDDKLRISYVGRPRDQKDLESIASGADAQKVMNENFKTFITCMDKFKEDKFSDCNLGFSDYSNYIYNKTSFLVSELPSNYSPKDLNLFFEKMNSAGRQLSPVEQIKGKYFPEKGVQFDDCLNFERRYSPRAADFSKAYSLTDILTNTTTQITPETPQGIERSGIRSVLTPEVFLLHSLCIASGKKGDIPHDERKILETFKANANSVYGKNDPESGGLLKAMADYRKWLDENIICLRPSGDDSYDYVLRRNVESDQETEDDSNNYDQRMCQYQSMLFVSSDNWQEWVLEAYCSSEVFSLSLLKAQDLNRHSVPCIDCMTYKSINRYWFWKLDYILWEKSVLNSDFLAKYNLTPNEISAIQNYKFRRNRSIEHLHPQTDNDANRWESEEKDQFGNLAMISSSFNSLQQNESIGVKFARLRDTQIPRQRIESIKMLLMFKIADGEEHGWTPQKAKEHGDEMHNLLTDYHVQNSK